MPKTDFIELGDGERIPILFEDRSVIAIDKPPGWMLVPETWQKTIWNLQAALNSSIAAGDFWARSRNLKYLRAVHRLDAETSGVLLLAKSPGALHTLGRLFESRQMEKTYLAVVAGVPRRAEWECQARLAPDPDQIGRMRVDEKQGKDAETHFRVCQIAARPIPGQARPAPDEGSAPLTLVEARPVTGRTHQIRVHLAVSGFPILGDPLYGKSPVVAPTFRSIPVPLGLRAVALSYPDPFTKRAVRVRASSEGFLKQFGFGEPTVETGGASPPR